MDQQQQSRWPTRRQLLWAGGIAAVAFLVIVICGYLFGWKWTGLPKRTLWDWLQLLIIPAVLAGGGLWFNRQQRERELGIAREQREQEVEIAERRTQDEALQAYLDQMSAMLIPNKDQPSLYKARPGDSLSSVARARTLTVLPRLDGDRKARVVQFLYESGLIAGGRRVLVLRGADLRDAYLSKVNLFQADLSEADLNGANLSGANLNEADLSEADLSEAYLIQADLEGADLIGANLSFASLSEADLSGVSLIQAHLSEANLIGANLSEADLSNANLSYTDLRYTDLGEADLNGANLSEADLSDVKGISNEELEQWAASLKGVTMPNGQKYEDWLKDKKAQGKDKKNE